MASKHPADETDSSNKCPVCQDDLEEPQSLPCEHKMCGQCLTQQVSASASADKSFPCPSCGKKWKVLDGGVIERVQTQRNTTAVDDTVLQVSQVPFCVKEEHGPATAFCKDCSKFFCEDCIRNHQQCEWMSDHELLPVADMSSDDIKYAQSAGTKRTCAEHDLPLSILCMTCTEMICHTCLKYKHKGHEDQELTQSATEAKMNMNRMTDEANKVFKARDEKLRETEQTKETIRNDVKRAKNSVKEAAQQTCDAIRKHEKRLLAELDRYEEEAIQISERIKGNLEACKAGMTHLQKEINSLLKFANPIQQVERAFILQEKLYAQQEKEAESMTWEYVRERKQPSEKSRNSMLGKVQLLKPKRTPGNLLYQVPLKYTGPMLVAGMAVVGNCLCVVHFGDPHVWLYDMANHQERTCVVPHLENPRGMALVSPTNSTVAITDRQTEGGQLHFVNMSRNLRITYLGSKTLSLKTPGQISVSLDNFELIIGQEGGQAFVVCDLQGNTQRPVTVSFPDISEHFPWCVQRTASGYAAIMVDKGLPSSTIEFLKEDGTYSHRYGNKNGKRIKRGQHMVTDSAGRLVVADFGNRRLHLVNNRGHLVKFLLAGCMPYPHCLFLDETAGRLYVAHCNSQAGGSGFKVAAYKWQPLSGKYRLELTVLQL